MRTVSKEEYEQLQRASREAGEREAVATRRVAVLIAELEAAHVELHFARLEHSKAAEAFLDVEPEEV
jgi:hypothetical protein